MTLEINLDTATMEELEYFKNIIELKIGEIELAQERLKNREMINTYRICLIENIKILLSCKPRIENEGELYKYIKNFIESTDKQEWIKEYFLQKMAIITIELCQQFKFRLDEVLNEHDTYMLLCDFKVELSKIEL